MAKKTRYPDFLKMNIEDLSAWIIQNDPNINKYLSADNLRSRLRFIKSIQMDALYMYAFNVFKNLTSPITEEKKPIQKVDNIVELPILKDNFKTFAEYFEHVLAAAMDESGNHLTDIQIKNLLEENLFIKFSVKNIPFTFKLI